MGIAVSIYLVLCLMVAYMGRRTRVGFYRALLFSLMLTPLIVMVYLLIFETVDSERRRKEDRDRARMLDAVDNERRRQRNREEANGG
jgi:hypothetical protein